MVLFVMTIMARKSEELTQTIIKDLEQHLNGSDP